MGQIDSIPTIVVLISADIEWQVIGELFPEADTQVSPFGEWFSLSLSPSLSPITFFHGGWGKIAAAASTQYAIDRWGPDLLVNLGTCGGFAGEIEKGEIILVEHTIVYDIIEQMGDLDEHIAHYTTDLDLSWLGDDYPKDARRSLLVSGDRDLLVEDIPELKSRYGAIAGDWESGAIAWVAQRNGVKTLILRGVSDLVGDDGSLAYGDMEYFKDGAREIMGRLLKIMTEWLKII
ncbi:MAG: 5'-methylthioadenosine/S-adenosylhomocysteine nucleosidase [Anaerolineales bacterium]|nr:5'-methylthioadenosine/S-adenosylhomocysteine nucleosidase [Chloroflexota bacterium]MBL6979756.1 5'-methylthioadenosine/S-adenosylhomocysteine nucleosidase [Anaerolineales bacterium]